MKLPWLAIFIVFATGLCAQKVTFSNQIAPIIFENCTPCHQPDEIGPMPFTNYDEVRKFASMISHVTETRYMPPWLADTSYRSFRNQRVLSEKEIETIKRWVEGGAVEGKRKKSSFVFAQDIKSELGEPDLVVCMEEAFIIEGTNKDILRTFVVPLNLDSGKIISAVQFRPGNTKVVHHSWIYFDTSGIALEHDKKDNEYGFDSFSGMRQEMYEILAGYLPGSSRMFYPEGSGKKLLPNSYLLMDIHYAPTSVKQIDSSCIDIFFTDEQPGSTRYIEQIAMRANERKFHIPANETKTFCIKKQIKEDLSLFSMIPHMHYRGTKFKAFAVTPENDTINLISINDWDFNWQSFYYLDSMIKISAGSTIHVEAQFDNTESNPFNPILPPIDVNWGSSNGEMLILLMEILPYQKGDEDDPLSKERKD
jgi:hypothetical protein